MLEKLKNLFKFFKKEKVDLKLEDTKSRIYKSDRKVIDDNILKESSEKLEQAQKEKKEIESKKVSDKSRNRLAELNTDAMFNMRDVLKNNKN